eukprot:scaffold1354_cov111-Isochrysis_galbana.AAC.14
MTVALTEPYPQPHLDRVPEPLSRAGGPDSLAMTLTRPTLTHTTVTLFLSPAGSADGGRARLHRDGPARRPELPGHEAEVGDHRARDHWHGRPRDEHAAVRVAAARGSARLGSRHVRRRGQPGGAASRAAAAVRRRVGQAGAGGPGERQGAQVRGQAGCGHGRGGAGHRGCAPDTPARAVQRHAEHHRRLLQPVRASPAHPSVSPRASSRPPRYLQEPPPPRYLDDGRVR